MKQISQLWIDLFCGAGGTSQGLHTAKNNEGNSVAKVVACINHDPKAIQSHAKNFPDCLHCIEDIRTAHLAPIQRILQQGKHKNPQAATCLWASLECTHFSKAKGGGARDADSRTLANYMFRYVEGLTPDYIYIENVYEFMSWGELNEHGKPISKEQGKDYVRWVKKMCSYGYNYDFRLLNCADYGAPTTRVRYFGVFAKKGLEIRFPQPTHSKVPKVGSLFNSELKKWRPVKECLDFSDEGNCIFDRKTPLSERTLERIYAGLVKYVAGGKNAFIANYYSGNPSCKVSDIDDPSGTITTIPHQSVVKASFMPKFLSNNAKTGINAGCDVNNPCPTVTTQGRIGLCQAFMVQNNFDANGRNPSLEEPARTVTASGGQLYLCHADFLMKYFGGVHHTTSVDDPASTLTTKDRLAKVSVNWLDKQYGTGGNQSINEPATTLTNVPKLNFVETDFLNTQLPSYLSITEWGEILVSINKTDSEATRKIKQFMASYGIFKIKMRMLKVSELKAITGFPVDYVLAGSQADQKKFIGNAVPPPIAKALAEALHEVIVFKQSKIKLAA